MNSYKTTKLLQSLCKSTLQVYYDRMEPYFYFMLQANMFEEFSKLCFKDKDSSVLISEELEEACTSCN